MPSESEKAEDYAELDAAWWKEWWAADYSWNGLAKLDEEGAPEKPWIGWSVTPEDKVVEAVAAPAGSRAATLQDFWRWDSEKQLLRDDHQISRIGLLCQEPGHPKFHLAHFPTYWQNSDPSWKTNLHDERWPVLEAELQRLIAFGAATQSGVRGVEGADRRAQLQGSLLRAIPLPHPRPNRESDQRTPTLHLNAAHVRFLSDASFSNANLGPHTNFQDAMFTGIASFYQARFGADAHFQRAIFRKDANFQRATFAGRAYFGHSTFLLNTNFRRTRFTGNAAFHFATFAGTTEFHQAECSHDAYFQNAIFGGQVFFWGTTVARLGYFELAEFRSGAYFQGATVHGGVDFTHARFADVACFQSFKVLLDASFAEVAFSGPAKFDNVNFPNNAKFSNSKFSEDVSFKKASFSGDGRFDRTVFLGAAAFRNAKFTGSAYFHNTIFSGDARFDEARFSASAYFMDAQFLRGFYALAAEYLGGAFFPGTIFGGPSRFGDAQQTGVLGARVLRGARFSETTNFRGAVFKSLADFARCRFPDQAAHRDGAFNGTQFFENVDFKGVERLPFSAFQGALLDKGILIGPDHPKEAQFRDALKDARRAADRDDAITGKSDYNKNRDPDFESRFRDARFAALEAGCGVLKHAMMQTSDRQREQSFYRMELIARRHRPVRSKANPDASVTWWEAFASRLYGWVSDYGGSAMRPLAAALLALPLTFGAITLAAYAIFNQANAHAPAFAPSQGDTVFGALGLAYRNALTPFHAWSESFGSDPGSFAHAFRAATGDIGFDFLLAACHLQSLLSVILVFLAGLALRRKFQIS
ncbi:pentapeptide repeat-containing protein [Maricaulis sp.]|uniref:pentapeptide repeat-containing protein n=1 Tax=Maricaulis sp. TaxID=1486257 RepID=UPI003A9148F2